jgi:DegV family protein with EDD domain
MEKIGLLIDSTTHTREELKNYDFIKTAQLKVVIDNKEYRENELSREDMEKYLSGSHKMLTSQPAPVDFLEFYKEFKEEGYTHVMVVVLSEKISGTYQSALIGKTLLEDNGMEISIHSPKTASFGIANGIEIIAEEIKKGKSFSEIIDLFYKVFQEPLVTFTLGNLLHLFKGGRLNRIQALFGVVLRIKPIIEMIEGKLELVTKTRTNKACYEIFIEKIKYYQEKYNNVHVDIIDINMPEWSEKIETYLKKEMPNIKIHRTDYVSPVFFVHLGNKGFGISVVGY